MPKRILTGTVVSSNTNKTIVVKVTRRVQHKLYKKIISQSKKYYDLWALRTHKKNYNCQYIDAARVNRFGRGCKKNLDEWFYNNGHKGINKNIN